MTLVCLFLRDDDGAISVDRMEVMAGLLTLGMLTVYATLSSGSVSPTGTMSEAVAWMSTDATSGEETNVIDVEFFHLTESIALPVGSVAAHSDGSFTSFATPEGGWVDAWSDDGNIVPEGAKLTSLDTFTLRDGSTMATSNFSFSYQEVYSSNMNYSFRSRPAQPQL